MKSFFVRHSSFVIPHFILLSAVAAQAASVGRVDLDSLRTPIYTVDGDAFVRHNGDRYCNRPLYCDKIAAVVLAGDKPFVRLASGKFINGSLMLALVRGKHGVWFQNASDITSRYECGRMSWTVADQSWGDTTFDIEVVPTTPDAGLAMRVQAYHPHSGDQLVWAAGGVTESSDSALWHYDVTTAGREALLHRGFTPLDCRGNQTNMDWDTGSFRGGRSPWTFVDCLSPTIATLVDAEHWQDPANLSAKGAVNPALVCGTVQLAANPAVYLTLSTRHELNTSPADEFARGLQRVNSIENQVTVDTPDPWLNAAVSASNSVIDGVYRAGMYTHAGMRWSTPLIGWRNIYGGTVSGWHDRVMAEAKLCIAHQITQSDKTAAIADPRYLLASQSPQSRLFGVGRINLYQPNHYDMQSQFFEQLQHAWRWTGDADLEKLLRPALDLHCQYIQECFDPDKQGIYESYANTWPTDDQWYNGGGTSEETAYAYRAEQTAMLLAQRAGDANDAQFHHRNLARIRDGFFKLLWNSTLGHPGAYREQGGLHRLHDSCWLYSIFCPIDAGLLNDEQSAEALNYTETDLERIDLPYGGQQCWPSNWVPSIWSVREMWPGDNYQLALAYFQTGLADEGFSLLHGTFPQQLLFGPVPGDLGHPAGATDFTDCASTFCRTVVEGLFGYQPNYPDGVIRLAPQFPRGWDHASIRTPDFSFVFQRHGAVQDFQIGLTAPARIELLAAVSTTGIKGITVDGHAAPWELQPGFGKSVVKIAIRSAVTKANVEVICNDALPVCAAANLSGNQGDLMTLTAQDATIIDDHDPQGVLADAKIVDGALKARLTSNTGDHLVFALAQVGQTQQWRRFKIHVNAPPAEPPVEIPASAPWTTIDMHSALNGDIRTIYQQKYLTPHPATCSLRLATDGYSTWQMVLNPRNAPPQIGLDNIPSLRDSHGRLVTPDGAPFAWPAGAFNIAFTSQWDNWPRQIDVPVNRKGDAIFFLLCGTTNPMEVRIANARLEMTYADGVIENLDIVPPMNFWTLCPLDGVDYNYQRNGFSLPKIPPPTLQLGRNCRAIVLSHHLRPGVELRNVRLAALSEQVVIGLMGVSLLNPPSGY